MHYVGKELNEECAVFGIWGHENAAKLTYYGLHSMQHRGQEGAGIAVSDGKHIYDHKGLGLVNDVFDHEKLETLSIGNAAIGHVRYSTQGGNSYANVQPLVFRSQKDSLSIAHNGNLVNAHKLKGELEERGSIFQTTSDTEVIAHLIKRDYADNFIESVKHALSVIKGAYALAMLTEHQLIAALDPNGLRPLSLGKLGNAWVVASETCAFDLIGATYVRDVNPGEIIVIDNEGLHSDFFTNRTESAICSMEYIYFSRPDSNIQGINVHAARKNLGRMLAQEAPVEADVVTGVPDSSISAAIGYAEATGIPYELGMIKNRYVGRTFIQPSQELREQGVKMKLSAVRAIVEGKRVVMVDDSIVRGTTSRRIVGMLREAGATEVHVRISSPPITHPCFYGIDTSTSSELIASTHSVEDIREMIGADSLVYLSVEGMQKAIGRDPAMKNCGQCMACFTGKYPTEIYPDTVLPHEKELLV
ncbi:amidophosphoribosyltransferase [Sporolactobacillus laevolacticus]|uniref:Amidophosphoribosyltransferase n=1 Tax=Sporolactobacillus laevolacticus DSM 442 TaxID=1395513 RepID=V6J261_9BACL|nr:amidophosphoribosyltransferase [Sporolactobacillus laevolacticus]EST10844.1 amidophosphoribosyltransferase [Sporolactobacillus laevolacticus DSM 442]MDN3955893.1 amidophosphoribosyltransferase [Sporolactobacillus laevolacticus]